MPAIDFRALFERSPNPYMLLDRELRYVAANEAYLRATSTRLDQLLGRCVFDVFPQHPASPENSSARQLRASFERVLATGRPDTIDLIRYRVPIRRADGTVITEHLWSATHTPLLDEHGEVAQILQHTVNVTEQVRAREELTQHRLHLEELVRERTRALQESEAALLQAQKMEAVGNLTGGVAHDFNNLLQVIGGNLQLLERGMSADETQLRRLRTARGAVDRGAKLASQLLTFARRQPLEPIVLNLGNLVRAMDDLLRRALGENIEVRALVDSGLWNSLADPTQLENAILNLAINARDAMNGEGRLTIETHNTTLDERQVSLHPDVAPGDYVMLAISDSGSGMTREVMQRAFEPFFTTKPEGQGTGLGLSMVYGLVKQSGGHLKIDSEVGRGTTIRLYLPRESGAEMEREELGATPVVGGSETILVAEDDPGVRATTVELLQELGYRVLQAADGQAALAVLEAGARIDLLFSDVVMPGPVAGTELARRARALQPGLEVLFASGYAENAVVHGGRIDPGVRLLSKPYRREDLARRLRHIFRNQAQRTALDGARGAAAVSAEKLRILFVEDDADIRESASEVLAEELGHALISVGSAEEAVEVLAREGIDLLFTDVGLPGMSGLELVRNATNRHPGLLVIIASGSAIDLPGAVILPKPYDLARMRHAIDRVIASRQG